MEKFAVGNHLCIILNPSRWRCWMAAHISVLCVCAFVRLVSLVLWVSSFSFSTTTTVLVHLHLLLLLILLILERIFSRRELFAFCLLVLWFLFILSAFFSVLFSYYYCYLYHSPHIACRAFSNNSNANVLRCVLHCACIFLYNNLVTSFHVMIQFNIHHTNVQNSTANARFARYVWIDIVFNIIKSELSTINLFGSSAVIQRSLVNINRETANKANIIWGTFPFENEMTKRQLETYSYYL